LHQAEDLEATWNLAYAAIDWEPRVGKTKLIIDTAARLYTAGVIDAVLVVAPNGVHLNWTRDELPAHWPLVAPTVLEWMSDRSRTKKFERAVEAALSDVGPVWTVVNFEALHTARCLAFCRRFAERRRTMLVVDESHHARNPKADVTRALMALAWPTLRTTKATRRGGFARAAVSPFPVRRVLSATMGASPFDLWSQYYALHPDVLGRVFTSFRARVAVLKKNRTVTCPSCGVADDYEEAWAGGRRFTRCRRCGTKNPVFGPLFDEVVEYRNLDRLRARIAPCTFSRKKKDCLTLPPRVESRRSVVMPDAHRRAYESLRDELVAWLDSGAEVDASHALTRLLRLQQASRGYLGVGDDEVELLEGPYPAAEATRDLVLEYAGKSIVWCQSPHDVDLVCEHLAAAGVTVLTCDGRTPQDERPGLRVRFREDPAARVWLGTLSTGGEGVDLSSAGLMIFYSHGFSWFDRVQGLERNYGSGQKAARIDVVDVIVEGSVDRRALDVVARKGAVAGELSVAKIRELVTGDTP
jgi:hypothetical protein